LFIFRQGISKNCWLRIQWNIANSNSIIHIYNQSRCLHGHLLLVEIHKIDSYYKFESRGLYKFFPINDLYSTIIDIQTTKKNWI
jgi:hypothetical protein